MVANKTNLRRFEDIKSLMFLIDQGRHECWPKIIIEIFLDNKKNTFYVFGNEMEKIWSSYFMTNKHVVYLFLENKNFESEKSSYLMGRFKKLCA